MLKRQINHYDTGFRCAKLWPAYWIDATVIWNAYGERTRSSHQNVLVLIGVLSGLATLLSFLISPVVSLIVGCVLSASLVHYLHVHAKTTEALNHTEHIRRSFPDFATKLSAIEKSGTVSNEVLSGSLRELEALNLRRDNLREIQDEYADDQRHSAHYTELSNELREINTDINELCKTLVDLYAEMRSLEFLQKYQRQEKTTPTSTESLRETLELAKELSRQTTAANKELMSITQ